MADKEAGESINVSLPPTDDKTINEEDKTNNEEDKTNNEAEKTKYENATELENKTDNATGGVSEEIETSISQSALHPGEEPKKEISVEDADQAVEPIVTEEQSPKEGTEESTIKIDETSMIIEEVSELETTLTSPTEQLIPVEESQLIKYSVESVLSSDVKEPISDHEFSDLPGEDISCSELSENRYPYLMIKHRSYSFAQMEDNKILEPPDERQLTPVFLDLMCKKNKDKTLNLILRGSQLINNLKRRLRDTDLLNLKEYLHDNKLVVSLDLAYNNITSEGLKIYLIPLLQENRTLKELTLSNNEICLEGLNALSEVSSSITLTNLRLNGNKLGSKSGEALAKLIDESPTLINLDISETDQDVSSLACIAAVLRRDYIPCFVNRYPFSRYPSEEAVDKKKEPKLCSPSQLAIYLRHLVNQQPTKDESRLTLSHSEKSRINCPGPVDWTLPLKKIKLKNYTDDSEPLLGKVPDQASQDISKTDTLIVDQKCLCLKFEGNSLSNKSTTDDSDDSLKIERKPILEVLFLDRILGQYHYQPLTHHFARILSEMLKVNDSLKQLHLEKNSLMDSDIQVLCQGLKENSSLQLLDLSANHIGSLGLSYLADTLPHIRLEALILNHNAISDHGARCLFFTLPSTNLRMLDLAHNSISDRGMMDLLYAMRKLPKILVLCIWGNPITQISLQKIKEYLIDGWLLTDSLDIQLYEVDEVLRHAWRPSADPFKYSYYQLPNMSSNKLSPPPQSTGTPLEFVHYDTIYPRTISQYVPLKYLYPPPDSNTCST